MTNNKQSISTNYQYDQDRRVADIPEIEMKVMRGEASNSEAREVALVLIDHVLDLLARIDEIYMNRDGLLSIDKRLSLTRELSEKCIFILQMSEETFNEYPSCANTFKKLKSSVRYQEVFTLSAIIEDATNKSLFDHGCNSIH